MSCTLRCRALSGLSSSKSSSSSCDASKFAFLDYIRIKPSRNNHQPSARRHGKHEARTSGTKGGVCFFSSRVSQSID